MHRECNRWKGTMTLDEARRKLHAAAESAATRIITNLVAW